ncbi:hypothetical protein D3H65_16665 [Paraflavitalea soli]|uniref:Uncharacterized protein n=1 Tax=Paraflavitalea soli TaxID=2315862 RepID=A0A3B7MR38_9BACT|nr:hypothetical protein D3H65_16665 [Paraflavitalea soli]
MLIVLSACGATPGKEEIPDAQLPLYRYKGVFVAETNFGSAKQWDTLNVHKTAAADSFIVYHASSYIKTSSEGRVTKTGSNRDTFPGFFNPSYRTLMLGPAYSMKDMSPPPIQPMYIDTIHRTASFGGIQYKKLP